MFVILVAVMVAVPAGLVIGYGCSHLIVPLYYRLRNIPPERQSITGAKKSVVAFVIAGLVILIGLILPFTGLVQQLSTADNYWESRGFGDWYRMPLEYPYELVTTQLDADADIRAWQTDRNIVRAVVKYHKSGNLLVGEIDPHAFGLNAERTTEPLEEWYHRQDSLYKYYAENPRPSWFTFDCGTGKATVYDSHEDFVAAVHALGVEGEPELLSIRENWKLYWANPRTEP
jgi:hypothetical protein